MEGGVHDVSQPGGGTTGGSPKPAYHMFFVIFNVLIMHTKMLNIKACIKKNCNMKPAYFYHSKCQTYQP